MQKTTNFPCTEIEINSCNEYVYKLNENYNKASTIAAKSIESRFDLFPSIKTK